MFCIYIYSTSVSCAWEYSDLNDVDFDHIWRTVQQIILQNFAGDPVDGVPSPSVQNTIYLAQKDIMAAIKQVIIAEYFIDQFEIIFNSFLFI